jgi:hypothetical protein
MVISEPAWTLEDHHLEHEPGLTCQVQYDDGD